MALLKAEHIVLFGLAAIVLQLIISSLFTSPLRHIPGPFLARFTDLWRLVDHWRANHLETQRRLHERYGPAVRIGPNTVSLSDPALLKTVYSTRGEYLKSEHFSVADGVSEDGKTTISTIFSTRSNAFHAQKTGPITKLYSLPSILKLEPLMDQSLMALCHHLDQRFAEGANKGKTFDMAEWIDFFAWDNSFELAFSKKAGFMETGADVGGILYAGERTMRYIAIIGQLPFLDKLLGKNPYLPFKLQTLQGVINRCIELITDRAQNPRSLDMKRDMLDGFFEAKESNPGVVDDYDVVGYAVSIFAAGSDTSANLEKAVVYNVLKNPKIQARLTAELDAASFSSFPPRYKEIEPLAYLDATIKEGLRMHPPIGVLLERVVPRSGLVLPAYNNNNNNNNNKNNKQKGSTAPITIPAGTIVGMNAWVLSRDKKVFGDDVDVFRPERWLRGEDESEADYKERVAAMKEASFSWGGGNRVCIGKNLATVNVYKFIATLFSQYQLELANPEKEWTLHKYWLVFAKDFAVRASRRTRGAAH